MSAWAGYDAWLEAPYQRAAAASEAAEWAEEMLVDEPVEFDACDCEETHTSKPEEVMVDDVTSDRWECVVRYDARCPRCGEMQSAGWSYDRLP